MGKFYQKQILRIGKWFHPQAPEGVLNITPDYLAKVKQNFSHTPFAPVIRGHAEQQKVDENPELIAAKNITNLQVKEDGLYADFELDPAELDKYNDVSVSIESDYVNHETGELIGPVLKHVALVTNPFIKGLKPFVQLKDTRQFNIILSDIHAMEEQVKDEQIEKVEDTEAVVEQPAEEVTPDIEETQEETAPSTEEQPEVEATPDAPLAPAEPTLDAAESLKRKIAELTKTVADQEKLIALKDAESDYSNLLKAGKVTPAQKEAYMNLASLSGHTINLADGKVKTAGELVKELFDKAPTLISFSEKGADIETGETGQIALTGALLGELRQQFPEKNDVELQEYLAKNQDTFKKYVK